MNLMFALSLMVLAGIASAEIKVVTSIPDLEDMSREIGGDLVSAYSLATGREDIHYVPARSIFLPKIRRADLVICLGLDIEDAWLPGLVSSVNNPKVQKGNPGWIEAYQGMELLEVPTAEEAKTMLFHRHGNPHVNTGPYCGKIMAGNIARALIQIDPGHRAVFEKNLAAYEEKLQDMEKRLLAKGQPLATLNVITFHADLSYFCKYFSLTLVGTLEPSPGVPPNPRHLAQLIEKTKDHKVSLVLYNQSQSSRYPQSIAERLGAQAICFDNMAGGQENVKTWIQLQEYNLDIMLQALEKKP